MLPTSAGSPQLLFGWKTIPLSATLSLWKLQMAAGILTANINLDLYNPIMFAISFDMVVADLKEYHGNPSTAYTEIKDILYRYKFEWIQGSTYVTKSNDLSLVFQAIYALAAVLWFRKSVRDIRAYRVEDWSDFTNVVKNFTSQGA